MVWRCRHWRFGAYFESAQCRSKNDNRCLLSERRRNADAPERNHSLGLTEQFFFEFANRCPCRCGPNIQDRPKQFALRCRTGGEYPTDPMAPTSRTGYLPDECEELQASEQPAF